MIEAVVGFAVLHRRAVLVVTLIAALIAGVLCTRLRFDALPDVTTNQVLVLTQAPGLTPEEVERLVTRPIEISLGGIPGMVKQRSISRYGISSVTAIFDDDVDAWRARQMVQERVALAAERLPEEAMAPELGPLTGGLGEIFHFTVRSPVRTPAELLELVELRVVPLLRTVDGVVEVNTWGGERRTLDVVGQPVTMARWGVGLGELGRAVVGATGSAAGSSLADGTQQVLLRGVARPKTPAELGEALVRPAAPGGAALRIADVAEVRWGAAPRIGAATADGAGETVYVMVQMLRGANALQVMQGVHEKMGDVTAALPEDVAVDVVYDRSSLVHATLVTVAKNLLEGGVLVIAVLFLLLGSLRAGLLVAAVIPLSMLFALAGMAALDIPGNLMSLGAIDFGLLVDGAVVMVEAVFCGAVGQALGAERVAALTRGVARPVFFSVLVILLVYVPILALTGVDGKMFRPMAAAVSMALLGALVLALTFVPAAAAAWLRARDIPAREPWLVRAAEHVYAPVLALAVRLPAVVAVVAIAALMAGGWLFSRTSAAFVPQLDEGDLVIQVERSPDISLASAVRDAGAMERRLRTMVPEVRAVVARIGSPAVATDIMGIEQADVFVELAPRSRWRDGLTKDGLVEEIDEVLKGEADALVFTQPIQMRFNELLGGAVTDVSVGLYGEDLTQVRGLAEQVARIIKQTAGAVDVRIMAPPDVALLELRPRLLAAAGHGMTAADVLDVIRAIRTGVLAGHTFDGPLRIPIRVRLGEAPAAGLLAGLPVPLADGALIELGHLATIESQRSASLVNHDDAQRRIVVGFNIRGAALGQVVTELQGELAAQVPMPRGVRMVWGGQYESLAEARARLGLVIPAVLVAIVGALVLAFGRLRPAMIVLTHVPFACIGGILALVLRDLPLSLSAAIGFIALSGIAVLNGVVLVSRIHVLMAEGLTAREAAVAAARSRLRPVLMTALVAALGFVPMMLATGTGAEVQRPLATVVVGGLVTSTILTLIVLPSLFPFLSGRTGRKEQVA